MHVVLVVVGLFLVPSAAAHPHSQHGTVLLMTHDALPAFLLVESIAPGTLPNGVISWLVWDTQAGDSFTLTADDGQEPFLFGSCDEPNRDPLPSEARPTDPSWWLSEWNAACYTYPDFDIVCGAHVNGVGDEAGVVDCFGAVIFLWLGDVGEGFTYSES